VYDESDYLSFTGLLPGMKYLGSITYEGAPGRDSPDWNKPAFFFVILMMTHNNKENLMRILLTLISCSLLLAACSQSVSSPPSSGGQPPAVPPITETDLPLELPPTKEPPVVTFPTLEPGTTKAPPAQQPALPFDPKPEDGMLERSTIQLDYVDLLVLESYPVQINLELQGYLPTPCHNMRVSILPPDQENRIDIEVYTVVDPAVMCIQVIKEFETVVSLGSFPTGHYSVYVNGELAGEFDS